MMCPRGSRHTGEADYLHMGISVVSTEARRAERRDLLSTRSPLS